MLLKHDIISDCIQCCRDPDKNTRKFACFAVGNAGFHNDKLYEHLRPVVPLLVELLKDPEVNNSKYLIYNSFTINFYICLLNRRKLELMLQGPWEILSEILML